jgi:hypothetical protein
MTLAVARAEPHARVEPPTIALIRCCSWVAEKWFRRSGSFATMLWITENADGRREQFETECRAPVELSDDTLLAALVADMRADFARDGVVRFAVAYPGQAVDFAAGPLANPG